MAIRFALVLVLGALTGIAGWWTLFVREQVIGHELELKEREERIALLEEEVAAKVRHIRELEVSMYLLKVDHRVARIEVVEQLPVPGEPGQVRTTVRFVELDEGGEPIGPGQEITLEGSKVYLETLVIKFEDDYVEGGEFLRGSSVCLFRRMFSEDTAPTAGVEIDAAGTHPTPYTGGDSESELFYAELWQRFWDYANDPEAAAAKGVRAIHGEAPFVEARPGRTYRVELRASGGLSILPE